MRACGVERLVMKGVVVILMSLAISSGREIESCGRKKERKNDERKER